MSKTEILNRIKKNKAGLIDLPGVPDFSINEGDVLNKFSERLKKAGGEVIYSSNISIQKLIQDTYGDNLEIISVYPDYEGTKKMTSSPHELKSIDVAVITGVFGVAENGAIWILDNELVHRALPFITENLIIVLEKNKLVENMHQAYDLISENESDFGLFISGPSKTADIEQSLVIGAHGAKSLYVYLL